jgi:hypothetical protein
MANPSMNNERLPLFTGAFHEAFSRTIVDQGLYLYSRTICIILAIAKLLLSVIGGAFLFPLFALENKWHTNRAWQLLDATLCLLTPIAGLIEVMKYLAGAIFHPAIALKRP